MTIQITDLTKQYSKNTVALNHVSLTIGKGIFGLLGRNGSGKTTLMHILTTLLKPTTGEVEILGMSLVPSNYLEIKKNIGYLPQEFGFYKEFSVLEIMQYICIMRGFNTKQQRILITDALEQVNMLGDMKKKYKQLSGGMKRRVGLAQAILGNPPVLIVDEPTAGVDPEERIRIRKLLNEYSSNNTVLFSTHIIEDIEYTCNQLAILDSGNLLYSGNLQELLHITSNETPISLEKAYVHVTTKGGLHK